MPKNDTANEQSKKNNFLKEKEFQKMKIKMRMIKKININKIQKILRKHSLIQKTQQIRKKMEKKQNKQNEQPEIQNKKEEVINLDRNHILGKLIKQNINNNNNYKIIDMTGSDINDYLNKTQDKFKNQLGQYNEFQKSVWGNGKITNEVQKKRRIKQLFKNMKNKKNQHNLHNGIILLKVKKIFQIIQNILKKMMYQFLMNNFQSLLNLKNVLEKQGFILFNLISLLVIYTEQEIQILTVNWKGSQEKMDILFNEYEMISKVINLAKDVYIQKKIFKFKQVC
ncbi:unnamed protein product [Paramecium sonneborni]|uniref:Uncharacterized protein n=1 Tax=Paramecium sonneborni TaxID=65129 RepID=A0A8S1PWL2_9CILI|nr:unnamed protein product [Paramecium sonneborni]